MAVRKRHHAAPGRGGKAAAGPRRRRPASGAVWLYGSHSALAALANPARTIQRIVLAGEAAGRHSAAIAAERREPAPESVEAGALAALLPPGAVHQGIAVLAAPLSSPAMAEACAPRPGERSVVLVLDRVTDPRNIGAALRSAAAFGARAVVVPAAHTPPESGALAKAASGALEAVPLVRAANLARALDDLARLGYWRVGLDAGATEVLSGAAHAGDVVLVLGAEGAGLRRLTAEHCDFRVRLPTRGGASLNVAAAATVALYELVRAV